MKALPPIIAILVIEYVFAQAIPPNDPIYLYLRQEFRKTHNLSLFIQPYPFPLDCFEELRFLPPKRQGYLRVSSSNKLSKNIPDFRFGIWAYSKWKNISILVEPVVVHDTYGETVLGETYTRAGVTGRFENAMIRYNSKNIIFQFGRAPVWWGQSWESSVIQSGNFPPYDFISTQLKFGSFQLELLSGQLHSVKVDSIGRFKRFIGGKKLMYISKSGKLLLSVGDLVLYSGVNRSMEGQYLNPIVPYFFASLEEETEYFQYLDHDNAMIFFDGRYVLKSDLSAYYELLIDDFQLDIEKRDEIPDALGWKFGLDGMVSVLKCDFGFEFEYTRVFGNTYITKGWFTNWEDRGIPIGYKYGPDCQSFFLLSDFWLKKDILVSFSYTYLEKGGLTLQSEYDQWGKPKFPSEPVSYHSYFNPSFSWHSKYGILEFGFDGDLQGSKQNSFYLKAQIVLGMGYDL